MEPLRHVGFKRLNGGTAFVTLALMHTLLQACSTWSQADATDVTHVIRNTFSNPSDSFSPAAGTDPYASLLPPGVPPPDLDVRAPADYGETNTDPPEELKRSTAEVVYSLQARMYDKLRNFEAGKTRAKVYYEYRSPEPSPTATPSATPTISYKPRFPYRPADSLRNAETYTVFTKRNAVLDRAVERRLAGGTREPTEIRMWVKFQKQVWKNAVYRTVRDILTERGLGHKFSSSRKVIYKRQGGFAYLVFLYFQQDYRATLVF